MIAIDSNIEMPAARSQRAASGVAKGKSGEREALAQIVSAMQSIEQRLGMFDANSQSHKAQRNLQQSIAGGCDLAGLPGIAVEVKRCETLQVAAWWRQAVSQASRLDGNPLPVLLYRQSRQPWRVYTFVNLQCPPYGAMWAEGEISFEAFLQFYSSVYENWLLTARSNLDNL